MWSVSSGLCMHQAESYCLNFPAPRWDQAAYDECQSLNMPLTKCLLPTAGMKCSRNKGYSYRQVFKPSFKRSLFQFQRMGTNSVLWLNAEAEPSQEKWTKDSWSLARITVLNVAGRHSCLRGDKTQSLVQGQFWLQNMSLDVTNSMCMQNIYDCPYMPEDWNTFESVLVLSVL